MKQLSVKINGIDYFPGNILSATEEPLTECSVNYRALVNDKLRELGTFYEDEDMITATETTLFLVSAINGYSNAKKFIRAGRVQDVLDGIAYYGGNNDFLLWLSLINNMKWEDVYSLLLDNEPFITKGI